MRRTFGYIVLAAVAALGITVMAAEKPPADFQMAMKNAGGAIQSVGKAAEAKDYAQIEKDAATFKATFTTVGKYFTEKKNDDALTFCGTAFKAAGALETAAKAKDDMGIADARKALGGACGGCTPRTARKTADGSFEIK